MTKISPKFAPGFGICAIIASLFVSGCAHQTGVQTMRSADLDYFQVNCDIKEQQIKFLQSQRTTRDQQLWARLSNALQPWQSMTDPDAYKQRHRVGQGYTNWILDQHLMTIARECR